MAGPSILSRSGLCRAKSFTLNRCAQRSAAEPSREGSVVDRCKRLHSSLGQSKKRVSAEGFYIWSQEVAFSVAIPLKSFDAAAGLTLCNRFHIKFFLSAEKRAPWYSSYDLPDFSRITMWKT